MRRFVFGRVLALGCAIGAMLPAARVAAQAPSEGARKRRQPPPAPIPMEETGVAAKQLAAGNYQGAVAAAKTALNKNEKFTPAMLIMAKAYYKLHKYEWVRTLWGMMQANGASDAEKGDVYQMLAFMEREKGNIPGAIEQLKKATEARPENAVMWNNLGAHYLEAKNYRDAAPVLEKAVQLLPNFAKGHLNLGNARRGLKDYTKAQESYQRALQIFPNYADAVFNMGILYLDADKMPEMDLTAKMNASMGYFQRYKQMIASSAQMNPKDPADQYILEAQENITKEQKRIERLKKAEEREKARAAQKAAKPPGAPGAAAPAAGGPAAAPAPAAPKN